MITLDDVKEFTNRPRPIQINSIYNENRRQLARTFNANNYTVQNAITTWKTYIAPLTIMCMREKGEQGSRIVNIFLNEENKHELARFMEEKAFPEVKRTASELLSVPKKKRANRKPKTDFWGEVVEEPLSDMTRVPNFYMNGRE